MAVPDRAISMIMVKLGEENWTALLLEAPATKSALKQVPSLLDFSDKFKAIPADGFEHWLRVRPALQYSAARFFIHNALVHGNTGPAFTNLREGVLKNLVASEMRNVTETTRSVITTLHGRLCISSATAAMEICEAFNRLDQSFIPQFIPEARQAWDKIVFQAGVHSIHSYLDSLLLKVSTHFQDVAVHDREVRNKFTAEMHTMAQSVDGRFSVVRQFYDYTLRMWTGSMTDLLSSLEGNMTTRTVIAATTGPKNGARVAAAAESGDGGGVLMGDVAVALQELRTEFAAAKKPDTGLSANQITDLAKVFALALGETTKGDANKGDAGASTEEDANNTALAQAYAVAFAQARRSEFTRTEIVVVKKLPLQEIIKRNLLPPGIAAGDLHPGVRVGKECAFCKALRKNPWRVEWESVEAYMEHYKCGNPLLRAGQQAASGPPARRLESNEVIKHNEEECFRARIHYSQKCVEDAATYSFLLLEKKDGGN